MAIEHTNRCGDTYYLHEGKTKLGKPKYYFSKKNQGTLVATLPDGFEIYENSGAQVYLRKIQVQLVTEEEVKTVEQGVRVLANQRHFFIDVEKRSIIVYLPDTSGIEAMAEAMSSFGLRSSSFIFDTLAKRANYQAMMSFHLINEQARIFTVHRWCFRGAIDNWIPLSGIAPLAELVATYCPHLGQESFFDLML